MLNTFVRWVLLALALILVAWIVPGIQIANILTALITAAVIGVINLFIRPIIMVLTLPINIITLGLFTFIINAFLLMLTAYLVPGFAVSGFFAALIGSLLLSILSVIINRTAGQLQPA